MCSPKGTCFLYVKEELQSIIEPLVISWGYEAEVSSGSQFLDYLQWQGTKDISAYLTLPYTIKFLKKNNWNEVSKKCHNLTIWAKDEINNLLNQPSLADNDFLGQMSSFYINSKNPKRDQLDFYNKYNIQIPFIKWNNQVLMRISIQAYNSKEDVNKLLEALKNEYC
jgi:isopenicillin-N epimerase